MLDTGNKMLLLIPDSSNKRVLHPGKVIESNTETFVAEFEEAIAPPPGANVNAYADFRGKFSQQGAAVVEVRQTEPHPIIVFSRVGERVSAESRQIFRVGVVMAGILAAIEGEKKCSVVDMSAEGIGIIAKKQYDLGSLVRVAVSHEAHAISTVARVQTMKQLPDGRFRYGFLATEKRGPAGKALEQISASLQRQQLRRLSGAAA